MESIGKGVWELKTADERTWYRVMYLTQIGDRLYILHAFEKSSRKSDRRDLETARSRFQQVEMMQKNAKEKRRGQKA
jgi:phage-related protein